MILGIERVDNTGTVGNLLGFLRLTGFKVRTGIWPGNRMLCAVSLFFNLPQLERIRGTRSLRDHSKPASQGHFKTGQR